MDIGRLGGVKVEHQNGGRDGEKAVAQRRDAAHLATGESVVVGLHGVTIAFGLKRVNPARSLDGPQALRNGASV